VGSALKSVRRTYIGNVGGKYSVPCIVHYVPNLLK
jgi:hypothetical protein